MLNVKSDNLFASSTINSHKPYPLRKEDPNHERRGTHCLKDMGHCGRCDHARELLRHLRKRWLQTPSRKGNDFPPPYPSRAGPSSYFTYDIFSLEHNSICDSITNQPTGADRAVANRTAGSHATICASAGQSQRNTQRQE